MINTVLFDMDGTLLPFEQDEFLKEYFARLCARLCPFGYTADQVVKAVWSGTKGMIKNDGSVTNRERFWDGFAALLGEEIRQSETVLDGFYNEEFHEVKKVVRGESPAAQIVRTLRKKGYTVVLATNPLFPDVAQYSRMSWVGLDVQDFALVTHYANSHFCKPNPRYFEEILGKIGKTAQECLMVGNSVSDDMVAATLGMDTYLVTDFTENPEGLPTDGYTQGSLADFAKVVQELPCLTDQ